MKKLLISASIFANITFFVIACTKSDMQDSVRRTTSATSATSANLNEQSAVYTDHFHGLTFNQVTQMLSNYGGHQSAVINSTMNIDDARSCWFSLKDIKSFVGHLEAEVKKNKTIASDELGIRFYYGAHSNPAVITGIPANYAGLHNLVMIPTYKDMRGANTDFDPYHVDQSGIPLPLDLLKKRSQVNVAFTNLDGDEGDNEIFSMDHGVLYPPTDPTNPLK